MERALLAIPSGAGAISPAWLTARLGEPGRVTAAVAARIGVEQGFTGGRLYRLALTWDPAGAGPPSVVVKLSPAGAAMRRLMRHANAAEVRFYRDIAPRAALPVPRCPHAAEVGGRSVVVMEDLAAHRRLDLRAGCGPRDAEAVVAALARVHAAWWNRPELADAGGADLLHAIDFAGCWPRYPARLAQLLPDVALPGWFVALAERMARQRGAMAAHLLDSGPMTLLHRDCHVENVLFALGGQAVLLDWQFMGRGRGAFDLGYFLISSLPPDQRQATERDLVARYHAGLVRGGVTGYSLGACWQDYLWSAAGKFWLTVVATVAYDNAGTWKAEYRRQDLARLIAFCADHGISDMAFLPGAA